MNKAFYYTWKTNRVNRIIDVLGKEWFKTKEILELGACTGQIGNEFIHLGANLSFSEINPNFLSNLQKTFSSCPVYKIDQNKFYNLNKKFDLVLHLGVLYHIENWEQDLECALNHTNILILDTKVISTPLAPSNITSYKIKNTNNPYVSFNKTSKHIDELSLIKLFNKLNVKYLRIDVPSMTTPYLLDSVSSLDGSKDYLKFLYGWNSNSLPTNLTYIKDNNRYHTTTFQTYLILK